MLIVTFYKQFQNSEIELLFCSFNNSEGFSSNSENWVATQGGIFTFDTLSQKVL